MRAIRRVRRANRAPVERALALPPGYRASWSRQAPLSIRDLSQRPATLAPGVQDLDRSSAGYGGILWMLGYDDLSQLPG